jgi:hypothetical protein
VNSRVPGDASSAILPSAIATHFCATSVSEHSLRYMFAISFHALLGPASIQSVVSASWILVWLLLMYHCCSGLEVVDCLGTSNWKYLHMHKRCLHYKRAFFCSSLRHDYVFCVLLGSNVDFAVAFGYSNLGEASCGERERRKSR